MIWWFLGFALVVGFFCMCIGEAVDELDGPGEF